MAFVWVKIWHEIMRLPRFEDSMKIRRERRWREQWWNVMVLERATVSMVGDAIKVQGSHKDDHGVRDLLSLFILYLR